MRVADHPVAPRRDEPVTDVDVIIVGAGPTGLMLAAELRLAGVRPLVLERQPQPRDTPKANGLGGQILHLLHYRGLLERFAAASTQPSPAPRFPFGGVHLDFTDLADPPLHALQLPQPRLESLLDERARELGADIRRGHEVVAVSQDDTAVIADVRGPDMPFQARARYLVGCDGAHSRVRDLAGIPFPGTTYPDVNRLGQVTVADSVIRLDNGDLDVPGLGRIRAGYTRTERGLFGFGPLTPEILLITTVEDQPDASDDGTPMTLTELQESIRRVLGADLPLGKPLRLSRFIFQARQAERYRERRILLAGDAAHLFPATGVALNAGLLDTVNLAWKLAADIHGWAPAGLLDTYHGERHLAGVRTLLHTRAQVALRRGQDPAADALREVFQELLADEQPLRRVGALVAGTDIRYPVPGSDRRPLTGAFAPDLALHTDQGTTSVANLMHAARPVLLDLADRPDLREIARQWEHRVDIRTAKTDDRPADALLIRPDAHIAWAASVDEHTDTASPALRQALSDWFGTPLKHGPSRHPYGDGMIARASTAADLDRVLAWTVQDPVSWVDADAYRAEAAEHRYRPEWTWIAEDEAGRMLARAVWWGRSDSERPAVLDCLSVAESVVDPIPVAAGLLDAAHTAFGRLPRYQIKLATGWADDPSAAAAVVWRRETAYAAGLTHEVQRLQYEWSPAGGVPASSGRLVFTPEPDDAVMLEVFRRIGAGSLDAETRRNVAAVGAAATARKELAFYLDAPGDRDWWRLAHTPDGELAGLAVPSATPYGPNVGYLGVLPELRGNGYVDDILAEVTRVHAERGATRITATTDLGNAPMAAAFGRAGYRNVQARIVLSAPSDQ